MSTPEIITVNSEALEAQIRELLPSQRGFGSELQASNVIMPIIDLTAAAEGSILPESLQQSVAFGSSTTVSVEASTQVLANSAGFYRVQGVSMVKNLSSGAADNTFTITDGSTTKTIWQHKMLSDSSFNITHVTFDFVFFLTPGDSCSLISNNAAAQATGSVRQVADVSGLLTDPVGFTAE